jgi:hypothetical protein
MLALSLRFLQKYAEVEHGVLHLAGGDAQRVAAARQLLALPPALDQLMRWAEEQPDWCPPAVMHATAAVPALSADPAAPAAVGSGQTSGPPCFCGPQPRGLPPTSDVASVSEPNAQAAAAAASPANQRGATGSGEQRTGQSTSTLPHSRPPTSQLQPGSQLAEQAAHQRAGLHAAVTMPQLEAGVAAAASGSCGGAPPTKKRRKPEPQVSAALQAGPSLPLRFA